MAYVSLSTRGTPPFRLTSANGGNSLIVMAANCAGISGSQIFRTSDQPRYLHGLTAICVLAGASWVLAAALGVQYYLKRRKAGGIGGGV